MLRLGRFDEAMPHFQKAVEAQPQDYQAHYWLGRLYLQRKQRPAALRHLRQVLRLRPNWPALLEDPMVQRDFVVLNDLAWTLATSPEAAVRSPEQAVRLAERAAAISERKDANVLDTLAAAYACAGRYAQAAETARAALGLFELAGNRQGVADNRKRLELYLQNRPYYEGPPR